MVNMEIDANRRGKLNINQHHWNGSYASLMYAGFRSFK